MTDKELTGPAKGQPPGRKQKKFYLLSTQELRAGYTKKLPGFLPKEWDRKMMTSGF